MFGDNAFPIRMKGIPLGDIRIGFQWQEVKAHVNHIFRLFHHLVFCNLEGGLCYCHGKVIDLNAVKLPD